MVTPERTFCIIMTLCTLLALVVAFVAERAFLLVPCALCLVERWPYRAALVIGIVAIFIGMPKARWVMALFAATVFVGAVIAGVHVGVEQGAWPSPLPECAAPHIARGTTYSERLAQLPERPSKPCDEPTYVLPFLPISFATMNLVYALAISGTAAIWAVRTRGV